MMKLRTLRWALALVLIGRFAIPAQADQGMWLPLLLKELNEDRMQELGMRMSAEDIYSVNNGSLKDAIVSFGGYCTGQVISSQGLLLTNHHCGYGTVQSHSSVENDLLTKGFWAMSQEEELPNPGLFVTFIVRIEDVTEKVLEGITDETPEVKRDGLIQNRMESVAAEAVAGTPYEANIKPFFFGAEYYMFVTETYTDVRLVGAPPSSIGKFGGDTDNWEWPRHTGDFSMFRIYTAPDGSPADYAEENIPLKPKRFLNISLGGVEPGDFTMVFGFPGNTDQYLTSAAVRLLLEDTNPHRIAIREAKLAVMDQFMQASDAVRIQYASKYASTANYWKKWIGESMGLEDYNAVKRKETEEAAFMKWVAEDPARQAKYGNVIADIATQIETVKQGNRAYHYLREAFLRHDGYRYFNTLYALSAATTDEERAKWEVRARGFLKNYDAQTDRAIFDEMVGIYMENVPEKFLPKTFQMAGSPVVSFYFGEWYTEAWLDEQLAKSNRDFRAELSALPALDIVAELEALYGEARVFVTGPQEKIDDLTRVYVEGLREMKSDQAFAPDANSTLRIAYGTVGGMEPADGLVYRHYTTLDGVLAKEVEGVAPTHEFYVEPKLKQLGEARDYGQWADAEGYLPVGFLASNHTTGGNSGSPVLDADGNLIGLNFDRTWQSTMSDVMHNAEICRNIAVDVRYICFIVDKFAGATHLIEEMNFVNAPEMVEE